MAATDYIICEGCLGTMYLSKKTKPRKHGPQIMVMTAVRSQKVSR